MKAALACLIGITIAEIITISLDSIWGIACHIAILMAVIVYAAISDDQNRQFMFLSLALVPLIRIISLSMPLANIPQVWWYPIIYIPLLIVSVHISRLIGVNIDQIGINFKGIGLQLIIALTGLLFGVAEYFILMEEAQATGLVLKETWLLSAFFLASCTGLVEEVGYREGEREWTG
ncbi:hypothetical protein ACFLYQ_05970 [Chloroflexota bacterium]